MRVAVLFITHNRHQYLRLTLPALLESLPPDGRAVIWDNGSNEETRNLVRQYASHPCVDTIRYSPTNSKLREPTNWFWSEYRSVPYLGKVDDDCMVEASWIHRFSQAHADVPQFGAIACWHFPESDFVPSVAAHKVAQYGNHRIMRNCWVCGSGYLMKSSMVSDLGGELRPGESFTTFCMRAAARGYQHGWYLPLVLQDHFDDPRSKHTAFTSDEVFQANLPLSAHTFQIRTLDEWKARLSKSALHLQTISGDVRDFVGPLALVRRTWKRLLRRLQLNPRPIIG